MVVNHPRRRFEQVAVDVQSVTPRTAAGSIKILVMSDTFTRFARVVPIPDEKTDTVARVILDEWVSIFGPMQSTLSDRGPNFIGATLKAIAEQLGVRRVSTSPLHPQFKGCLEWWNSTLFQYLACVVNTGGELGLARGTCLLSL